MDIMTESEFRKQIKSCTAGGYLFFGEEDYLKAFSLKSLREVICPDEAFAPFNDVKLEGLDLTPGKLSEALSTLPMMSELKLVEISGFNFREVKGKLLDEYCEVFASLSELDYNVLVVSVPAGAIDEGYLPKRPSALLKRFGELLRPVRFERSSPAMLARWVGRHFEANGVAADPFVCRKVVERCGTDMYRLASETDKLSWYLLSSGRDRLDPDDIDPVTVADTDYDSFALTNAITSNRTQEALTVLAEMKRRRIEPTVIMAEITGTLCAMYTVRSLADGGLSQQEIAQMLKLHEFRVGLYLKNGASSEKLRRAVELGAEADAALKLSPQGYTALERLICAL